MLTSDVFDAVAGDDEAGKSVAANWFRREDMLEGGGRQSAKAIFDLSLANFSPPQFYIASSLSYLCL